MTFTIKNPKLAVRVRQPRPQSKDYFIDPAEDEPVVFIAPGTEITELWRGERILDEGGNEVLPSARFFRTVETSYPYHLVVDMVCN